MNKKHQLKIYEVFYLLILRKHNCARHVLPINNYALGRGLRWGVIFYQEGMNEGGGGSC